MATSSRPLTNDEVEARAILEWVGAALNGEEVDDFGESFALVRAAMDLHATNNAAHLANLYLQGKLAYLEERLPPCRCGHHWLAHCAHTYDLGSTEPHHCSQADGCNDYRPRIAAQPPSESVLEES